MDARRRAEERFDAVRGDPAGRLALMRALYRSDGDSVRLPYRRAASAFMHWQLRRGLLAPPGGAAPGSPWWRAVNETLIRDGWEARELARAGTGAPSSSAVEASLRFIRDPTAVTWYRAHNGSVVSGYLTEIELAARENRAERFFLDLVLMRVLYAHALVAAPRLALGRLAPLAPVLGDPRLGMTGLFLSLSRVLPATYPLTEPLETYVAGEHGLGRILDLGVIAPRLSALYEWSAEELGEPALAALVDADGTPSYAWDRADVAPWHPVPTPVVRGVRRLLPPS